MDSSRDEADQAKAVIARIHEGGTLRHPDSQLYAFSSPLLADSKYSLENFNEQEIVF
jgi:hypothetical protein